MPLPLFTLSLLSFSPTLFSLRLFSFYADYFRHAMLTLATPLSASLPLMRAAALFHYFHDFIILRDFRRHYFRHVLLRHFHFSLSCAIIAAIIFHCTIDIFHYFAIIDAISPMH
jgi:hypothetical protein